MRDPLREATRWLTQAEVDLDAARTLSKRFPALACFHAQQSAEKALKAILYATGERLVLGHALAELGAAVELHSAGYGKLRAEVTKLDRYNIPTRYPNGLPEGGDPSAAFDSDDAARAIGTSAKALEHARGYLEARAGG
jgi:HEPN domain-containing protein